MHHSEFSLNNTSPQSRLSSTTIVSMLCTNPHTMDFRRRLSGMPKRCTMRSDCRCSWRARSVGERYEHWSRGSGRVSPLRRLISFAARQLDKHRFELDAGAAERDRADTRPKLHCHSRASSTFTTPAPCCSLDPATCSSLAYQREVSASVLAADRRTPASMEIVHCPDRPRGLGSTRSP